MSYDEIKKKLLVFAVTLLIAAVMFFISQFFPDFWTFAQDAGFDFSFDLTSAL